MDISVPRHARMSAAVATHLRDPMRRSAYALILATGLTSGLGLVFWALAARWLPTATVGIGAALVSVMALLANLSTLGLRNGLIRFLPTAGSASRRLIVTCYALCAVTAMVAAGIFLLGQPLWAERLAFLRDSPLAVLAFVIGTAFWVLFVLQDHVLVGLRQTIWVPLENGLCAVAKIALLPLLAFAGGWAVFGAAALPAAAAVLVVTTLIMRYLRRTTAGQERTAIPVSQLVRFAAADHFAALLWMGTADLLTLLVLNEVGPEASAYYFMANTIGYTLYLVISNVGSALVAEGARDPERAVTPGPPGAVELGPAGDPARRRRGPARPRSCWASSAPTTPPTGRWCCSCCWSPPSRRSSSASPSPPPASGATCARSWPSTPRWRSARSGAAGWRWVRSASPAWAWPASSPSWWSAPPC